MKRNIEKKLKELIKSVNKKVSKRKIKSKTIIREILSEKQLQKLNKKVNKHFGIKIIFPKFEDFLFDEFCSVVRVNIKLDKKTDTEIQDNFINPSISMKDLEEACKDIILLIKKDRNRNDLKVIITSNKIELLQEQSSLILLDDISEKEEQTILEEISLQSR